MEDTGSLGAAKAVINKVQTTVDGGARITLDVGTDSQETIKNILDAYLNDNRLVYCSFFKGSPDGEESW